VVQSKPEIIVALDAQTNSPLKAEICLSQLKPNTSFHEILDDRRHPLGIYNVSIARIIKKLTVCCARLEELFLAAPSASTLLAKKEGLIDYIELCLYAAAEHVDDLEAIARCFFKDERSTATSRHTKQLKSNMKPIRDRISGFTNAIKHSQSRLRICSVDFVQDTGTVCLHGFFIERFYKREIGPSPIFHSTERLMSVTSFLWSVLIYLFSMSDALCEFLRGMDVVEHGSGEIVPHSSLLRQCVIALARLPLYSFNDVHPFAKTRFIVKGGESARQEMRSNIYGSIMRRWSNNPSGFSGRLLWDTRGMERPRVSK